MKRKLNTDSKFSHMMHIYISVSAHSVSHSECASNVLLLGGGLNKYKHPNLS